MAISPLRVWPVWLGLLVLPLLPSRPTLAAPARPPAATLGTLTGTGYVNPGQRALKSGMRLNTGDQIILRRGKLTIRMADGTTIKLAGPAEFTVETPRDAAGRSVFQATSGRIFVNTRQSKGSEVRVVTPSATLAVRGSSAGADVSPTASLMWCDQGLVYVDAAGEQILLHPGYETLVAKGEAPPPPTPMSDNTHALNQILNLEASLSQSESTVVLEGASVGSGSPEEQRMIDAERVVDDLFKAYSEEQSAKVEALIHDNFITNDVPGLARNRMDVILACDADFEQLANTHFVLQPATSRRFYTDNDHVSLYKRWVIDAILTSGARFQQGGETLFVIAADMRIIHWEGDLPFGRFKPEPGADDEMLIATPTVLTPPAGDAPDVIVTQADAALGSTGVELTNVTAQIPINGVMVQTSASQGSTIQVGNTSTIVATNATFTVNGAQVTADNVSIQNSSTFNATGVQVNVDGTQMQAGALNVSGGTVQLQDVILTDAQGNMVSLVTATINPGPDGGPPVISGVTDTGQTIHTGGGQIVYEPAPGAPLLAGRGERLGDGDGFTFATSAVTAGPSDLYVSGGRLDLDGLAADLGVADFAGVVQAPATGYTLDLIPLDSLVPGQVLVVQLAGGGYAKIRVRAGTTAEQLYFDWVYNPDGAALSRGRRWPSRAAITFDAKVYNRTASGHQRFIPGGVESVAEFRAETYRNLSNGASVEAYIAPRLSTDRQLDSKTAIVDRFGVRYFMPNQFEVTLGDISSEFTPYTLNRTILGLSAWRNFSLGPVGTARLSTAIGPRWQAGSAFRLDGFVTGIRLSTEELRDLGPYIEDMVVGLNLVKSYRGKRQRGDYLHSTVASMDASLRLKNGLSLMAELARSRATDNKRDYNGDAVLLRAAYRVGPLRLILDRERVGTGFTTVSGSAAADQERTNFWLRYRPNEWLSANVNFLHTRDNLTGNKAFTTRLDMPRYGLSISPFYPILSDGFLRNLTVDLLLRETERDSDDEQHTVNKKARTLSVSLIQRMGDFFLTLGRDEIRDLDYNSSGVSRRGHATDLSLRWRPRGGFLNIPISPVLGYRTGRENYTGGTAGPVSSRITSRRIGVDLGDEDWLAVELGYELLDNSRTDLGGYDRRILNVDLTRALDREGNRLARISYRFSDNDQENGARSYSEGQFTGSISQKF